MSTLAENQSLLDRRNRPIHDLRISVTDRCNFRCVYCMPKEMFGPDHAFLRRNQLLSFEEIARVAGIFVGLGVVKLRITGGEPLVRKDLPELVRQLSEIEGVEDISLTTNASLLTKDMAVLLRESGLRRITVSLDALDSERFGKINDVKFSPERVIQGIENAAMAGLKPIKVNMVVTRDMNDDEVMPMVSHFKGSGVVLRFIEFMDVGNSNEWRLDRVVPASEIAERINKQYPIEPLNPQYDGEVAKRWRFADGSGEIGLISSVTQPFCRSCTRARLSAEGQLYTCLFATGGHDLKNLIRSGADDDQITDFISDIWKRREDGYSELRTRATINIPKIEMSYIGG